MNSINPQKTSSDSVKEETKPIVIRTLQLKKIYHIGDVVTEALRGIDVQIFRGEFVCIMGPSGSGKSTFFNMIGGLDSPTSGRVFIDEVDVAQLNAVELAFLRCHKIGYIFQSYNLVKYMTALENVMVPMTFAGVPHEDALERGFNFLEQVGLGSQWFHKPIEMSGGQQQRVAIARAMANNPAILLCDEPTANLDLKTGREILEILKTLNKEKGVTVISATHDHRMLDVSNRMMWIRDGRIDKICRRDEIDIEVGSIDGHSE